MMSTSVSSRSYNWSSDATPDSEIVAKLRRLKIQENILFQSLNKQYACNSPDKTKCSIPVTTLNTFELIQYFSKLKTQFNDIKNLFEDIKISTNSEETLLSQDMDEIKTNVLKLEEKIKTFKTLLQTELASYKSSEQELTIKLMNEHPDEMNNIKNRQRCQVKPYSEIVPSPVKGIMNSPFKCLEVQQFQEFMANSRNRYGGWNEYNHNIFVRYWIKYFGAPYNEDVDNQEANVENSDIFPIFLQDLLEKVHGITREDIITHCKWYSKFIYLKERQRKAIEKWKLNQRKIKANVNRKLQTKKVSKLNIANIRKTDDLYFKINTSNDSLENIVSDEINKIKRSSLEETTRNFSDSSLANLLQMKDLEKQTNHSQRTFLSNNYHESILKQSEEMPKNIRKSLNYAKPTKQWTSRCNSHISKTPTYINDFEDVQKLRIPTWRLGL